MEKVGRSSCRLPYPSAQPMYAAAERWRDEALLDDRSLFDGRPLDVRTAGQELVDHFINNPDLGTGSYVTKIEGQVVLRTSHLPPVERSVLWLSQGHPVHRASHVVPIWRERSISC